MDLWQRLHRTHLVFLSQLAARPVVSLYLATAEANSQTQLDQLAVLVAAAREQLQAHYPAADINPLLAPACGLLEQLPFWTCADHRGAAIFLWSGGALFLRTPFELSTSCAHVGEEAYVMPILPIQQEDLRFHILYLSTERSRLYKGDLYHAREVEWQELPASLGRLLADPSSDPGLVGAALEAYLPATPPLLLAGSEALRENYRRLRPTHRVLELPRSEELRQGFYERAWTALRAWSAQRRHQIQQTATACEAGQTCALAQQGNIDVLLLAQGDQADKGLLNRAALAVIAHSGRVYLISPRELPEGTAVVQRTAVAV